MTNRYPDLIGPPKYPIHPTPWAPGAGDNYSRILDANGGLVAGNALHDVAAMIVELVNAEAEGWMRVGPDDYRELEEYVDRVEDRIERETRKHAETLQERDTLTWLHAEAVWKLEHGEPGGWYVGRIIGEGETLPTPFPGTKIIVDLSDDVLSWDGSDWVDHDDGSKASSVDNIIRNAAGSCVVVVDTGEYPDISGGGVPYPRALRVGDVLTEDSPEPPIGTVIISDLGRKWTRNNEGWWDAPSEYGGYTSGMKWADIAFPVTVVKVGDGDA